MTSFIEEVRNCLNETGDRHNWPMYEDLVKALVAIDDLVKDTLSSWGKWEKCYNNIDQIRKLLEGE